MLTRFDRNYTYGQAIAMNKLFIFINKIQLIKVKGRVILLEHGDPGHPSRYGVKISVD